MHPAVENFFERPLSHKVAAWTGCVVFIGYIFWQFFYSAKLDEKTKAEEAIESLNTQITSEQRLARNLKKFRDEVKELNVKLTAALQELPDKREIPDLLNSVSNLARDSGLEVSLFRPQPEVAKDFFSEVPVSVSVEGTFHQVATFFDEVGRMNRIVNINQIQLKEPNVKEKITIKADCTATTFRYLEESERIQSPESGGNIKRRK